VGMPRESCHVSFGSSSSSLDLQLLITLYRTATHVLSCSAEARGRGETGPIAGALWVDEELEAGVFLDSTVTVADAAAVRAQLRESRDGGGPCEAVLQVAYADTILLNKVRETTTLDIRRCPSRQASCLALAASLQRLAAIRPWNTQRSLHDQCNSSWIGYRMGAAAVMSGGRREPSATTGFGSLDAIELEGPQESLYCMAWAVWSAAQPRKPNRC
jgi:hypothetical protein